MTRRGFSAALAGLACWSLAAMPLPLQAQAPAPVSEPPWRAFELPEGHFKVAFPGDAVVKRGKIRTEMGEVPSIRSTADDGAGSTYDVTFYDYPEARIAKVPADKLLGAVRDGLVFQSGGRLVAEKKFAIGKVAGREADIVGKDGTYYSVKLMLVGNRMYQLTAMAPPRAMADPQRFFASFQLTGGARR